MGGLGLRIGVFCKAILCAWISFEAVGFAEKPLASRCRSLLSASALQVKLTEAQIRRVVDAVRMTFSLLKNDPKVLDPKWRQLNESSGVESTGFCAAATNAIYHMLGGKSAGLTPMVARYYDEEYARMFPDSGGMTTHWWIRKNNGDFIDGTGDQYTAFGKTPPYALGRGSGFNRPLDAPTLAGAKLIKLATQILSESGYLPNGKSKPRKKK